MWYHKLQTPLGEYPSATAYCACCYSAWITGFVALPRVLLVRQNSHEGGLGQEDINTGEYMSD